MKLAHRLLVFSLGLIVLLIAGILAIVDGRLRGHITRDRAADLYREAGLISAYWTSGAPPRELAEATSITVGGRVTLVDKAGLIAGDAYRGRSREQLDASRALPRVRPNLNSEMGVAVLDDSPGAQPELYVSLQTPVGITRVAVETAAINRIFDTARQEVLTAGLIATLIAMLFSLGYAIYVSGPVIQLRDLARALSLRDYSGRPKIDAPGEVGELARSLVQLAGRLETLESVRREFIANVSHELCSPLTIASGFAATLVKEDLPVETRKQFASAILSNTNRMQRVVDDLLDLSRIESGGWQPRVEPVHLSNIANEVFDSLRASAASRGVSLVCDWSAGGTVINADPTFIRQILANLTENAIRYTSGGMVTVFSETDADGMWIGVRDTGMGIADAHLPRIFERFYRADSGRARMSGGTGLGLSIVKHMAEAHGGHVAAESRPGSGTTIRAFFPLQPARSIQ